MKKSFVVCILLTALILGRGTQNAQAQNMEERFQDLFVTAGYATAFGAALGAAFLSFSPDPASQLRYVFMGASLGFIGGSVLGSYIIFSPMISMDTPEHRAEGRYAQYLPQSSEERDVIPAAPVVTSYRPKLALSPSYNTDKGRVDSWQGSLTLSL